MIGTDSYHVIIELAPPSAPPQPDYRHSPIEITSLGPDFKMIKESNEPLKAKFLGDGVIRLFREFEDDEPEHSQPHPHVPESSNPGDDTMLSIVSIPTYFTAIDVLGFIGESYLQHITHVRILKSDKPNRFLVLLKFTDALQAAEFQFKFDGKLFNSMEPEACHVVYVKSVRVEVGEGVDYTKIKEPVDYLIPFLLQDPFTSAKGFVKTEANSNLVELPTCPVCLERMDATVTGLLTIPCQHTFHCQCLSKWKDDTCPICRYSNNLSNQKIKRSIRRLAQFSRRQSISASNILTQGSAAPHASLGGSVVENEEHCTECAATDNLWICLICGNVGCSRYAPEQHSLKHFVNTGHCFAMEIATSRVWDYAGDNYVHRLVTNEDGKIVELPEKDANGSKTDSTFDKVDEVGFEYSQLLISQLASQREYYESLLLTPGRNTNTPGVNRTPSVPNFPHADPQVTELEVKVDELTEQISVLNTDLIPAFKSKIKQKDEKINKLSRDLTDATALNESLSEKVEFLSKANDELKAQTADLSDQVKDLMFFLESQERFKNEPQDVKDGTIVIQQDTKRKGRKKK